jgi:osmotically inducible protein OsmC
MTIRTAEAASNGDLAHGSGQMGLRTAAYDGPYGFRSCMGESKGNSLEEVLGAAHAKCFSIALLLELTRAKCPAQRIHTKARAFPRAKGRMVHSRDRSRSRSTDPDPSGSCFRRVRAECQEPLPSVACLVGRRHPSEHQTSLSTGGDNS